MSLTVKASPMSSSQQKVAETAIGEANKLNAGSIATIALIYAGMGESSLGDDAGTYSTGGVWQSSHAAYAGPGDVAAAANGFLTGGPSFGNGGAIALARRSSNPVAIANAVENNAVYESSGGNAATFVPGTADSYGHEWPGGTAQGIAEARAIVAAMGGATLKGGVAGNSSGKSGTVPDNSASTTYAFSISGTGNPDEDYWTGINRLAQEVNWYLFSQGEYLYYLDGQEMINQKPALYVDRVRDGGRFFQSQGGLSYDNTAFAYVSDHKRKFRVQRRAKVALAQSPTEGTIQLICGIDEILGGDVIVLSGCGLGDGPWIVAQSRRSVFDVYTELTLVPAIAPITEAAVAGTTGTPAANTASPTNTIRGNGTKGTLAAAVSLALRAVKLESDRHCYTYNNKDANLRVNNGNGVLSPPYTFDCSGFCGAVYRDAGLDSPYGSAGYGGTSGEVNSGEACIPVSQSDAVPGDLVTFGAGGGAHVALWIGNGQVVNMGAQNEPYVTTLAVEQSVPAHQPFGGFWHLKGAS